MDLPEPCPGLVIRYSYLWRHEFLAGRTEGTKDRPCAIVMAVRQEGKARQVLVLPITHRPPDDPALAVEILARVKMRLNLDGEQSWIILSESNRFWWPRPDLRFIQKGAERSATYGPLPYGLFEKVRLAFIDAIRRKQARTTDRDD